MSEEEAIGYYCVYLIGWYSIGAGVVLYLCQKIILKLREGKDVLMLWITYLGMSRPIQLWLFVRAPLKDDLRHLWFLALDTVALMTAVVVFTKLKWYQAVIIELGIIIIGLATASIGAKFDFFGFHRFVH